MLKMTIVAGLMVVIEETLREPRMFLQNLMAIHRVVEMFLSGPKWWNELQIDIRNLSLSVMSPWT